MNQENEQLTKNVDQYVMLDVERSRVICIPMDAFIEHNRDIVVLNVEGWGDEKTYDVVNKPIDFKLVDSEFITAAKVRTRLLETENNQETPK